MKQRTSFEHKMTRADICKQTRFKTDPYYEKSTAPLQKL